MPKGEKLELITWAERMGIKIIEDRGNNRRRRDEWRTENWKERNGEKEMIGKEGIEEREKE